MGEVLIDPTLTDREFVFEDRTDAGRKLALLLKELNLENPVVLAIPSGGIPVGIEVAKALGAPLVPLVVRKAQLPWDTEAGFGAVNQFGDVVLNEEAVESLGLTAEEVQTQLTKALESVRRRLELFQTQSLPSLEGKTAIIVDDGLASGYTLLAALEAVKRLKPSKVVVAVPTCSAGSVARLAPLVDLLVCANYRRNLPFAVAAAYRRWRDLDEEEVLRMLQSYPLTYRSG
ncbi:MAG: phosphoribosyltransferase [Aquificae bacterium]|nr:phosphoribosyltransferase [Aquificota bacterium]